MQIILVTLPYFYIQEFDASNKIISLDEDTSRHVIQVLRMKEGEKLNLTDGRGYLITATIIGDHKKHCKVELLESKFQPATSRNVTIAISLLKNNSRIEWFFEKATEIGVNEIIPIVCERTGKQKFRSDRMRGIIVSAMLQSQQCWLPSLLEPIPYEGLFGLERIVASQQKFIAHCVDERKRNLIDLVNDSLSSQVILIGPEGDFTAAEIQIALGNHFDAVSLGDTRLRSETAGIVAATILRQA